MVKDKKMFALIIAIFISVLLITGWVFADHTVIELIGATPILDMRKTDPAPADEYVLPAVMIDAGSCRLDAGCD